MALAPAARPPSGCSGKAAGAQSTPRVSHPMAKIGRPNRTQLGDSFTSPPQEGRSVALRIHAKKRQRLEPSRLIVVRASSASSSATGNNLSPPSPPSPIIPSLLPRERRSRRRKAGRGRRLRRRANVASRPGRSGPKVPPPALRPGRAGRALEAGPALAGNRPSRSKVKRNWTRPKERRTGGREVAQH